MLEYLSSITATSAAIPVTKYVSNRVSVTGTSIGPETVTTPVAPPSGNENQF
jgi:hypothetical protein